MKFEKMASKTSLLLLAMMILLMVRNTVSEMSQLSKDKVNSGIAGGQKVVDFLSNLGDAKTSKVFNALGKMSSFPRSGWWSCFFCFIVRTKVWINPA